MRGRSFTRLAAVAAVAAVVAVLTSGCLAKPEPPGTGGTEPGDRKVEIFGAFGGDEAEAFEESLKAFEASSGIDVTYIPSANFTVVRIPPAPTAADGPLWAPLAAATTWLLVRISPSDSITIPVPAPRPRCEPNGV